MQHVLLPPSGLFRFLDNLFVFDIANYYSLICHHLNIMRTSSVICIQTNHDVWWEMKLFILWYINTEASQVSNGEANMNHPGSVQKKKKFPPLSIETTNGKNTHHKPVPLEENHHLPILGIILPQHTLLQHIPWWFNKHIKHL